MIRIQKRNGKWRIVVNDVKEIEEMMKSEDHVAKTQYEQHVEETMAKGNVAKIDPEKGNIDLGGNKELTLMSLEDYIELKYDVVSRKWKKNQGKDGSMHEYLKGQYILLRELLEPKYRRINP